MTDSASRCPSVSTAACTLAPLRRFAPSYAARAPDSAQRVVEGLAAVATAITVPNAVLAERLRHHGAPTHVVPDGLCEALWLAVRENRRSM